MKIILTGSESLRLEPFAGQLTIEALTHAPAIVVESGTP